MDTSGLDRQWRPVLRVSVLELTVLLSEGLETRYIRILYIYFFWGGGGGGKTDNIDKKKFSFLFCCYQLGHCLASNYVLRIIPQLVLSLL